VSSHYVDRLHRQRHVDLCRHLRELRRGSGSASDFRSGIQLRQR
jgi:hypothetical protein